MTVTPAGKSDFAKVRLLVLDVDGVMTDAGTYWTDEGRTMLRFSIVDGMGIVLAQAAGVPVAILTSSASKSVDARAKRLGVTYLRQGIGRKHEELARLLAEARVTGQEVCYVSDDINDYRALMLVGLPVAVANAHARIKAVARYTTRASGGHGAVREVCDLLVEARGLDPVELWDTIGPTIGADKPG